MTGTPTHGPPAAPAARSAGRLTIRETADGLGIHNPARRSLFVSLFLTVWLCGWAAGEFFAIRQITSGSFGAPDGFLLVWLAFWTLAGMGVAVVLAWQFAGVERLFATGGALVAETGLMVFTRRRVHVADAIRGLHVGPAQTGGPSTPFAEGRLRFETGGAWRSVGIGLDDGEAAAVLAALARHLPSTCFEQPR